MALRAVPSPWRLTTATASGALTRDEIALHEYSVTATLDRASHVLTGIDVTANVLPFPECPLAAIHLKELVGKDVSGLRAGVHKELVGLHACTHLNDMVRGFSDVPALAEFIPAR